MNAPRRERAAQTRPPTTWTNPRWLLELFAVFNLAFLALDIYLAHSFNRFAHWEEWIPVGFSVLTPLVLGASILPRAFGGSYWKVSGVVVGLLSICLGYAGMLYHLGSVFFEKMTLHALVYSAPFAAPLAYSGLGFLLLLNRYQMTRTEWARWVLLLAAGGFAGNFLITLGDHAQNGFFSGTEWLPVYGSALALACLLVLVFQPRDAMLRGCSALALALQVVLGVVGAILHLRADLGKQSSGFVDGLVYGAPIFAPMLLVDVALLGGLGLWALSKAVRPNTS